MLMAHNDRGSYNRNQARFISELAIKSSSRIVFY
jgi:hypothetical protein